ncbi:hypothetical protein CKM354_000767400 [Cercospora kikuchii]|uniref:IBR domain-containing protein n=1 Tax=Cercospora kikuchii TaxID=84275 RepID=A0A9P3FHP3_9PEZI|nr:uncharacterized protein CKM354_000767400 [Cercospora kikuchii]GIZ44477.1 hypothetical protein CKM354_000767400 [Cercospora kikuchii]
MRRPEHKCLKKDSVEKALEGLKRGRDYQFCPGCQWLIQLSDACNHMTCRYNCGTQFCYLCGQRAKKKSGHWAQGASCPLYGPRNGPNPLYEPEDDEDSEDDDEDEDDEEDEDGNEDNDPAPDGHVPDNNPNEDRGEDGEAPDHLPGRGHDADGQPPNHDAHDPPQNHDAGDHAPPHDMMDEAPFQEVHPPEHELDDGFEQANGQNFDANDPDQQADGLNGVDRAPEQRMIEDDGQEGGHDAFVDNLWEDGEEEDDQEEAGMFAPQFAGMFGPPRVLSIAERIEALIISVSVYRMNEGIPWYLVHDITGPNQDPPEGAQASIFSWFRRKDRRQLRDMYVDLQEWALQRMPGPFLLGMHALAYVIRRLLLGLDYYTIHEIDHLGERGNFRMYLAHSHPLADYVFGLMPNQANLRYPTLSRIITTYRMAKTGNIENLRGWLRQRMWTPDRENDPHIDRRHSLDSIALSLAMDRAQPGARAPNQVVPQ